LAPAEIFFAPPSCVGLATALPGRGLIELFLVFFAMFCFVYFSFPLGNFSVETLAYKLIKLSSYKLMTSSSYKLIKS